MAQQKNNTVNGMIKIKTKYNKISKNSVTHTKRQAI
jgi:hypothetical protein